MRRILLAATLFALAACSTIENLYTDVPTEVATLEAALAAAEHTALAYTTLPPCGKTAALACRDPAFTAKIGQADMLAYTAVKAARQAETRDALGAAQTALTTYQQLITELKVGSNP
jgi:hypothetical protein